MTERKKTFHNPSSSSNWFPKYETVFWTGRMYFQSSECNGKITTLRPQDSTEKLRGTEKNIHPLWLNVVSWIVLTLVPLGVLLTLFGVGIIGVFVMGAGFLGIWIFGELAARKRRDKQQGEVNWRLERKFLKQSEDQGRSGPLAPLG